MRIPKLKKGESLLEIKPLPDGKMAICGKLTYDFQAVIKGPLGAIFDKDVKGWVFDVSKKKQAEGIIRNIMDTVAEERKKRNDDVEKKNDLYKLVPKGIELKDLADELGRRIDPLMCDTCIDNKLPKKIWLVLGVSKQDGYGLKSPAARDKIVYKFTDVLCNQGCDKEPLEKALEILSDKGIPSYIYRCH